MSYSSIQQAMTDQQLKDRVLTATLKEAMSNVELSQTEFAKAVRLNPLYGQDVMIGPVAIATEAAYEAALVSGRGAPGHDVDIITDAAIMSAVQANWPADEPGPP